MNRNESPQSFFPTETARSSLFSTATTASSAAWSAAQIAMVAVAAIVTVGIGLTAISALVVASVTTFNLNNSYYGKINALSDALVVNDSTIFLPCADVELCSYVSFVNYSISTFSAFMKNGTLPNVTLSSMLYTNSAPFMANVSNAKQGMDNLVGEAMALQDQLSSIPPNPTLSTLSYTNGASFMANVSNGKKALDNLVGEAVVLSNQLSGISLSTLLYSNPVSFMANVSNGKTAFDNLVGEAVVLQNQINTLTSANGTTTLSLLNYTNSAPFMFNVTNGKTALDNLVGESLVLQSQINNLPATPTLSTLSYTNGAVFMSNVTNGKTALDNLVGEASVLQSQINNLPATPTLSTLSYTNSASFMFNVTNGKTALDNLVGEASVLQSQINNLPATPTLSTLSYTNGAAFMFNVSNGKTALDNLVGEAIVLQSQINNLPATPTLSTLSYTNGAAFMFNVTNGKTALDNLVGEDILQDAQIVLLQGQTTRLLTRTNRNWYVSATYGNDVTCDGSAYLPCATTARTILFFPNVSSPLSQNSIIYDNGVYTESLLVSIPPNTVFVGNNVGTRLVFGAGATLHPVAWSSSGAGYITFLNFGLIRCAGAPCAFDTSAVTPLVPVSATVKFVGCALEMVTPFSFVRAAGSSSYFALTMQSVVATGSTLLMQDLTAVAWSLSNDTYAVMQFNYNSSIIYTNITTSVSINGLIPHGSVVLNNYAVNLTVDWSLVDLILRDAATLTRNYVANAIVNVHGDILSIGSINGGLLTTGAGSGTTQYLTMAPGMGYTPTTPSNWPTVPTNQQKTNDYLSVTMASIGSTYYVETGANGGIDAPGCGRNIHRPCANIDYLMPLIPFHGKSDMVTIRLGTGSFTSTADIFVPCNTIVTGGDVGTTWRFNGVLYINPNSSLTSECFLSFSFMQMSGVQKLSTIGTGITDWQLYYKNITYFGGGSLDIRGHGEFTQLIFETVSANGGLSNVYIQDMAINTFGTVSINNPVQIVDLARPGFSILRGWEIGIGGLLLNATATGTTQYFIYNMNNLGMQPWYTCVGSGATLRIDGDTSIGVQNFNNTSGPIEICGGGTRTMVPEIGATGMFVIPVAADSPNFANVTRTTVQAITTDNAHRIRQLELASSSTRKNLNWYVSATYGNDVTCDGSASLPCASWFHINQLLANTSNEFAQNTIVFDNGLYVESNYIAVKPNTILSGNEIGTLLVLSAGAGFDNVSWAATGTGYFSVLHFGLFRCNAACNFDMAAAVPNATIFSSLRFYNTSIQLNAPMTFKRRADTTSYFSLTMESAVVSGSTLTIQDLTAVTWSLSGDVYTPIVLNYNSTSTYGSSSPIITIDGLTGHAANQINNYAFGITVDATILGYVQKDSATMTVTTVTGTSVNTHGDVLSYGVINGGVLTMGAGSTSFQYLTQDYGIGTAQDTPSDWNTPYPTNQHKTNTQLAARTRVLEEGVSKYTGAFMSIGADTIVSTVCRFDVNLNIGPGYPLGVIHFTAGGLNNVVYSGVNGAVYIFSFSSMVELISTTIGSSTISIVGTVLVNGGTQLEKSRNIVPVTGGTINEDLEMQGLLFLNNGDSVTFRVSFVTAAASTFTSCGFYPTLNVPMFSLSRLA